MKLINFLESTSDNYDNIVDISYVSDLNINILGCYQILYTASISNRNDILELRVINVVDTTSRFRI
jgi:hypothetical protein